MRLIDGTNLGRESVAAERKVPFLGSKRLTPLGGGNQTLANQTQRR